MMHNSIPHLRYHHPYRVTILLLHYHHLYDMNIPQPHKYSLMVLNEVGSCDGHTIHVINITISLAL